MLLGISGLGIAQTLPVEPLPQDAPAPVLEGITGETVTVPAALLRGLAKSEPDISAPRDASQPATVQLRVLVSKDGEVKEAVAVQGEGELAQAAVEGVKRWKYRPYAVDGEVRELQSTILLEFSDGIGKRAVTGARPGDVPRSGVVRLPSGVSAEMIAHKEEPVYPAEAKIAHVQGVVVLHAVISKAGDVESLQVVSGPPQLVKAAEDAVQHWKYRPYMMQGAPLEVETTINVNFRTP